MHDALDLPRDEHGRVVGFAVGREARMRDWAHRKEARSFERLIAVLRAVKWNREHPERRREINARHFAKPEVKARSAASKKRLRAERYRQSPIVYTCAECGSTWCRAPWVRSMPPRFCGQTCRGRALYRARKEAA